MSIRATRPVLQSLKAVHVAARPVVLARPTVLPATVRLAKSFSSTSRWLGSGESDGQLSSVLSSEHAYELESAPSAEVPEFLETFRSQGVWDVKDIPGVDDVVLTRKFGAETLKLTFQISDLDATETLQAEPAADAAASAQATEQDPTYITCSLLISKPNVGNSLAFDLEASEEGFVITNVAVFDKRLGDAPGAEGDWQRRSRYMGPAFDHLDEAVQDAFVNYLAERGVDEALSNFILSYCEHKEQKVNRKSAKRIQADMQDYVSWLGQVQDFVDQ